ncbi:MAG: tetratricopeptide repeat protein, partial [Alphaproteobacteria bacterium]
VSGVAIAIAVVWIAFLPQDARADQTDPRLDRLFAILHTSTDAREVDVAQSLIWDIWIAHDDDETARLMRRGIFAMAHGRSEDALALFDELINRDPNYAEAWNKRATLYFTMGDLEKSRADVERTLELEPRHFGALSGLGQIELLSGHREGALQAFEDALDTNPHLSTAKRLVDRLRALKTGYSL